MSRRYHKSNTEILAMPDATVALPTDRPVAVYYRQSTDAQVGNISTAIQTVDMIEYLKQRGWPADKIILIDMDQGVSGSTKIDERPGMRMLFDLITEGKISTVACQDEDRLFRDVTQIQVNIFIEACRTAHVLVMTPSMIYDFANELVGMFHARQFRFKSEMAAEYINSVIRGKLHRAKRRLLMEGRWAGAGVPPGFMIDIRKTLPDGRKNENWRRFIPFEPYAEVVNEYFRLFLSLSGNIRATVRHIHEHGPFYPDPAICKPPEGYKVVYRMHRYGKGYCPGRTGLVELVTNVAYIGHWAVKDRVVLFNNHRAIVPVDVFMRAFNYISQVTLDGRPNRDYSSIQENARPSREEDRPVERPLCAGMLVSKYDGKWLNVGTLWVEPLQHYAYTLWSSSPHDNYVWSKAASYVDEAVVVMLRNKLLATFDASAWDQALIAFTKDYEVERKRKEAQLTALEQTMENQVASLDVLTNPEMIKAAQARYEDTKAEFTRLGTELNAATDKALQLKALYALKESWGPALDNWPNMTRDQRRVVLKAFIIQIEATPIEEHGLHLVIRWRDDSSNEIVLPRQGTKATYWLPDETTRLLELIDNGASQIEIASKFPMRKWKNIRQKVWWIRQSVPRIRPKPIKDHESYCDYIARTQGGSPTDMDSGSFSSMNFQSLMSARSNRCVSRWKIIR